MSCQFSIFPVNTDRGKTMDIYLGSPLRLKLKSLFDVSM